TAEKLPRPRPARLRPPALLSVDYYSPLSHLRSTAAVMSAPSLPERSRHWKWAVCGLLLLATMINYMDRLTLNPMATRLMVHCHLDAEQYGQIESAFAVAFAFGALLMGWLADRVNVYWLYPAAVLVWSAAGFLTGFAWGFAALLGCRFLLGLAEAG